MVGRRSATRRDECRRRKIRVSWALQSLHRSDRLTVITQCDGAQPFCSQCTGSSGVCPGYRVFLDFRDERGRRLRGSDEATSASGSRRGIPSSEAPQGVAQHPQETYLSVQASLAPSSQTVAIAPGNISSPSCLIPGGQSVYRSSFSDVLQDRFFLPHSATSSETRDLCSGWTGSAILLGERNALLAEILSALSSVLVGSELQDAVITSDSRARYHRAISGVRRAVEDHMSTANDEVASEPMLMTCMACAKYEVGTSTLH